jgi:hypothetical protein
MRSCASSAAATVAKELSSFMGRLSGDDYILVRDQLLVVGRNGRRAVAIIPDVGERLSNATLFDPARFVATHSQICQASARVTETRHARTRKSRKMARKTKRATPARRPP